ncbi:RNA polymerase sigma factor [Sporosarcina sp. D27]|uniref:RNA polymerase sigma factor n=1 Tax=Sporosarcina sp. D27 TaxID=1382305 RepID=UPI00046ED1B4|nr:sigma-70 family RNA polymerase sigma factor [Sporosarcina sp. D27]
MNIISNKEIVLAKFDLSTKEQKDNDLYMECKKKVHRLALSYVKDSYLAEDLSHEILVKCYLNYKTFNGERSFYSWMYRIANNHCIDYLRKGYRQRVVLHESMELLNDKDACTPEFEVINSFDKEEIRNKLRQLPSKYEEVITLFYFKDQSLKEIQHHLNINLSTIKTRLSRAKRMLRDMYKDVESPGYLV